MHRPALYVKVNAVQRRDAEDFFDDYKEKVDSMSGSCIDVGCGPGDITVDLILPRLKPNSTVMCADISETVLNYAKESYGDDGRLSFVKLDIETKDLPKDLLGQFDHVTSLYCIHWCRNLRQAFENIYSLLRPGGTAFVTFIASHPSLDAFAALQAMPQYAIYLKEAKRIIPQFQHVDRPRETVMTLVTDAGFEVDSCSCRPMTYVFDNTDQYRDFFVALSPRETQQMSTDLHGEYVRDLMREALKREIVFNETHSGKHEYSILSRYRTFVLYLKKPSAN